MPLYEDFWGDLDGYWVVCRPKLKNRDHSAMDSHLKVAVRCRPLDARERALKDRSVVTPHADGTVTLDLTRIAQGMESATFAYDHVYGPEVSQREVFETIGYDAVEHAFVGYNVSLFAYGQTSSGKTFSMMGLPMCEDVGLIPRICRTIFHFVALARDEYERYEASIEASYLEVYNEKPRDLLVDPSHSPALQVRESPEVGVFVEGLSRHKTDTAHDVELLINSGTKYRTIAATKYNRESSRSHAVFELTLTQVYKERNSQLTMQKRSKVNLIDLAGSERTGAIGNKGVVFEEGASINKSLTVLGRCIKALAKLKRSGTANKSLPVPFRESVLTWYLRESLAGNAKTTMLANISPAVSNGTETYGTLRYAAEAKRIETSVHMNEDPIQRQLRQQAEEITKLRHQLAELEQARPGISGTSSMAAMERETLLSALEELRRSSWDAVRSSARFSVEELKPGGAQQDEYPLLVALTPDPMLSGKLKYSVRRLKDGAPVPFGIGRSARNSLELDGVGICQEHCEIAKLPKGAESEGGAEFGLRVLADAKVHLNGELIEGAPGKRSKLRRAAMQDYSTDIATLAAPLTPLHHGDRLILGPCRFVAIFVAFDPASNSDASLDDEENAAARQQRLAGATANWEYSAVVAEMMRRVGRIPRLFGSTDASAEGRLWEDLLRGLELANQANEIAAEMLVNVEFSVTMTTPLPPHFDETRMHELPALGAQVVIHCHTVLPANASGDRRGRASPSPPSSLHGADNSASYNSPSALRRSGSGRAQSRDSDADFCSLPSESQPRLFDVSLDVFVDFLAGLHDLFGTTALLCQALHADEDASSSASVQSPGSETAPSSPKLSAASRGRWPWLSDGDAPWLQGAVLRDVFEAADVDGDGLISFAELHGAMVGALGLDVRAEALKPVFDAFELAATTFMAPEEFIDFLITYLRIKFGGAIAHLVTNAKAFADYLGVTGARAVNLQRCALIAQAIASDASTEDGRRMPLAALAAHGYYSSTGDGLVRAHALVLPGLVLPRRAPSTHAPSEALEIDAEARHLLSVSLARLLDCPPDTVRLRHDSSDSGLNVDSEPTATGPAPTVTAAVSGLGDAVVGRALAALVNGDLRSASGTASDEAQLAERDAKINELEASLATAARANDEVAVLRSLVDALQNEGKPEGLSPTAEKVWASMSATALLLEQLRQDINKKTAAATSGTPPPMGTVKYPRAPDAKLREVVVKLAELLEVANARVVRAIDDEARMKEASKRLEVKVAQIVSKATSKTSTNSSAEHIDCLRQLVDARKQLAAMAKDNSAGRMARATAQELSLEDDLKDTLVEVQELEAKTQRDGGSESPRLAAQLDKASENAARLREEVGKLAARNRKLAEAVEERRETIARAISDAEGRLKVASRQAASAEAKTDEGDALKTDLTSQKLRVAALKERASQAESSYRGLLESLSSGKWQVVPKGTVTPETAWGPLSGKQSQLRVDTGSPSFSHAGQSSPTTEERRRDDLDVLAQQEREQSVERRLGESSDLQHQTRQLISQSEVRITRIGEIVERLDASSGMLQSLSPDHQSGVDKTDSFSDLPTSPTSPTGSASYFIFE